MLKKFISFSIIFTAFTSQTFAGKSGGDLSVDDITKSTTRIQRAFTDKTHQNSILENGIPVGKTSCAGTEFYITYRPSLGMEIINCADTNSLPLVSRGLTLPGNGHKGLTKFFSKESIDDTVVRPFMQYKDETRFPSEEVTMFIDGMSAGAHRAVETAIYLRQHEDTKNINSIILRYGDSKTFDETAMDSIHNLFGKMNIISFHGEGDKIVEFMNIDEIPSPLGTRINFSAWESNNYITRVNNRAYTGMDPNFKNTVTSPFVQMLAPMLGINSNLLSFLTPELWELHQPITYAELCPLAFKEHLEK